MRSNWAPIIAHTSPCLNLIIGTMLILYVILSEKYQMKIVLYLIDMYK
jgi:hypothetical protein